MSGKKKAFIALGIFLNLLLCGGLYVNYRLDQVVSSLTKPGILFSEAQQGSIEDNESPGEDIVTNNHNGSGSSTSGQSSGSEAVNGKTPQPSNSNIANDVQNKISKPIEKTDLIKAGLIILRRLDSDEISYLYRVGRQDSYSVEELQQARKILLTKLNDEEINTLRELGKKYGKELRVLDESILIQ